MTVPATSWQDSAACSNDPAFTADRPGRAIGRREAQRLLAVCDECPVLVECTAYASQLRWSGGVVIAGWVAPLNQPEPRPSVWIRGQVLPR